MTLRLRVVSDHRRLLGDRSTIVFGFDGGTLGRSADNDWVLPDPLRYVSAHHGRVQYRDGQFFLEDLSTNGIFLNDEELPVSKRFPGGYRLQNGDIVRVGEYQIVVAVEAAEPRPRRARLTGAAVPTSIHALHTLGRAAQTDIGAMLNLDELLVPDTSPSDSFRPVDAYGVPVRTRARSLPAAARGGAAPAAAQAVAAEPAASTGRSTSNPRRSHAASPGWPGRPAATPATAPARPPCTTSRAACRPSAAAPAWMATSSRRTRRRACCIWPASSSARLWWDSRSSSARATKCATASASRSRSLSLTIRALAGTAHGG